jgi:hypothetical protein
MLDLSNHLEIQEKVKIKTTLTACFRLDKKTMLDILKSNKLYINGNYYKVPEDAILNCLVSKKYGQTKLELEIINANSF